VKSARASTFILAWPDFSGCFPASPSVPVLEEDEGVSVKGLCLGVTALANPVLMFDEVSRFRILSTIPIDASERSPDA
jgi:hypothetical protein